MAYDKGFIAELPAGRAGMVNHENRLLSTPEELLLANGTTFESQLLRKEAGAVLFDDVGLAGSPVISASIPSNAKWTLGGGNFMVTPGSSPAFVANRAFITFLPSPTPRNTFTMAPVSPATAGSALMVTALMVAGGLSDSYSSATFTCTDTQGNTYTQVFKNVSTVIVSGNTLSYVLVGFYAAGITALTAADGITVTMVNAVWFSAAATADEYSGLATTNTLGGAASTNSTSNAPTLVMPSLNQLPMMVIGFGALPRSSQVVTGTGGFTKDHQLSSAAIGTIWIESKTITTSTTIIALLDWWSQNEPAVAGTVSSTQGSTTLVGVGTTFTNYHQNDTIIWDTTANPESGIIASVTDATHIELRDPAQHTVAGAPYVIITGPRLITAALDGKLYKELDGDIDAVVLKSGLSTTYRPGWFLVTGKEAGALPRKFVYFNGINKPQVVVADANFSTDITGAADWVGVNQPIAGTMHAQGGSLRAVAWGNLNDPHRLYFSLTTDYTDFSLGPTVPVRPDIGDRIYSAVSFQGVLFIFKHPQGIFYLDDSDLDIANWAVRLKSSGLGCAPSPYSVLSIDDDVMFLTPNGSFHLLSAVDSLGGSRSSDLSYVLGLQRWLRDNINLSRLNQVVSVWYPHKKVALWGVPGVDQLTNTLTLKFDFSAVQRGGPVKFSYSERDHPDALALKRSLEDFVPRPILGEGGFVWLLDQDTRDKGGQAYTGMYQLPHLDMSHIDPKLAGVRKQFDHLEILFRPVAAGTLSVQVFVDAILRQTLSFDATKRRVKHKLSCGDGYTFSVAGSNSVADEDFQVLSHRIYMKAGREDTSRAQTAPDQGGTS